MELAAKVQAYLREQMRVRGQSLSTPGFTVFFNPKSADDSWAIPDEPGGDISPDSVAELCAAFHKRDHIVRIQWIDTFAPHLRKQLLPHGFEQITDYPVLVCTAATLIEPSHMAKFSVNMCSSAPSLEEVKEAWNANAAGFEEELCATDEIAREFRNSLITARAFVARFEGPLVASGMFNEIRNGITEISGVSTLPAFRRRGFAANLTTAMARAAFAEGAQVTFLTAMSDAAARVYACIGYTAIGNLLKYGES